MMLRFTAVVFVLALLAMACNMPAATMATPTGTDQMLTEVAGTLAAMGSPTPEAATATLAPAPTNTLSAATPTTAQAVATATQTPNPCDQAQFIADVTIPDGTKVTTGQVFTKTWRLRNIGTCTWDTNYAIVFSGGDAMGAAATIKLPGSVPPNTIVDLSIEMKAPAAPGSYVSNWKLRNAAGQTFGVLAGQPFYVDIVVVQVTQTITTTPVKTVTVTPPSTGVIFDFAANVCRATWVNSLTGTTIPCPGTSGDSNGYVMKLENPTLETGAMETNPVILTVPKNEASGMIAGRFPAIAVQSGYHFQATLGCLNTMTGCSVTYQVFYSAGGAAPVSLIEHVQTYDRSIAGIDVDLSSLAGQNVELILVVLAGESSAQDQAVWVNPRILR